MIDQLITALSKEVGLSAEEIADTIWLALQIGQSESISSDFPLSQQDEAGINNGDSKETSPKLQPISSDSQATDINQTSDKQKAGIYPRTQHQTSTGSDLSFKVPDAPSLREPLTLARALKPLMRRIPSGTTLVLDEAATIQRIADEGLWLPVLRPTLEPWLDLELVVDESISMQIWRHTIRDLERLLKNYGIFRDVRVWGLIADEQEQVQIRRGIGATAKNQPPRSPAELIDPSGRRLVLVVSDCVSSGWRNSKVMSALEIWSKRGVIAIVQMLPKWLWKRTALGRASEVRLQGLIPGVFNQTLIAKEVSLWDELEEDRGIKVPVFTLEPDKVATWAQMLAGRGSVWTLGYVFKLDATPVNKESMLFNLDYGQMSAEQRVEAFRVTASPMARKLAGLLAAAPVITLPIVRLIRETLLKDSQQVHVAEVFLGGLLKPLTQIAPETNPDYVQYDFIEGIREILVDSVPSGYVLNVVDEISKYVAKKVGWSLTEFSAVLRNTQRVTNNENHNSFVNFATVTAQILKCLGGDYLQLAKELERDNRQRIKTKTQKRIPLDLQRFYKVCNPAYTLNVAKAEDKQYYINFSSVRGGEIIEELARLITNSSPNESTCQLFSANIGCGKSTELLRLKKGLEDAGFHVVYFESTYDLDMNNVDISDILLTIARQVSESIEKQNIKLRPQGFRALLKGASDLLQTQIDVSADVGIPGLGQVHASTEGEFSLALGIGKITAQAKESPEVRTWLRQYLEPRTSQILQSINKELLELAIAALKNQGKEGLVVIVDNLDRVDDRRLPNGRTQPEYLFVDRGEQLRKLKCHVVYTIPLALTFSNDYGSLMYRLGGGMGAQILPMVPAQLPDGSDDEAGMALLRQMVLARAFPDIEPAQRLNLIAEVFDSLDTLDRLCRVSGGHMRSLLGLLHRCIQKGDPPIPRARLESVIQERWNELTQAIDLDEWQLLHQVAQEKVVRVEKGHQIFLRSMFVFEYRNEQGRWFDVNPILAEAGQLS